MRQIIFRVLAGLLGVLFVWVLLAKPIGNPRKELGYWAIALTFLLFAILGERPSVYWLIAPFSSGKVAREQDDLDDADSNTGIVK